MTALISIWPLFGLTLTTPRLVLRPITDDDIPAAVAAAASGSPRTRPEPVQQAMDGAPADKLGPNMAQWYWRCRAKPPPRTGRCSWASGTGTRSSAARTSGPRTSQRSGQSAPDPGSSSPHTAGGSARRCAPPSCFMRLTGSTQKWRSPKPPPGTPPSLGVSRSLGYELNGVTRTTWGGKAEDVQKVRLTPETFNRPDWHLKVEGHEATARFLGMGGVSTSSTNGRAPGFRQARPAVLHERGCRVPLRSASPT